MSPEEWREAEDLFARALELPTEERADFLQRECRNDTLRGEVLSLLDHAASEPLPVGAAIAAAAGALARDVNPDERLIGTRLGAYRVDAIAGYGGMGAVYRASRADDEFQQLVAIKLVRPAAESRNAQQRFRQERQILARLSHPHIARLLDGGSTPEGIPYLVMEFIEGEPITAWCEHQSLSVEKRLEIFLLVCEAVEAANRELVIHRDLKPANILVTRGGAPKLLDFGIAKMMAPDDQDATFTATNFQAMTPDYASPEQVRGERVTAATDVYSLGLILYELLTGRKAQRFPEHTPDTIARVVCQGEPTAPAQLKAHLSGDLDNIIRKAIRKEPERRYQAAADLRADLLRYLQGRPVTARPDTFAYRAGKFTHRHRNVLRAGLVSAAVVGGGVALAYWVAGPPAPPRVLQVEQLTQTGRVDFGHHMVTDGSKLYFGERRGGIWTLAQIPITGGTPVPVPLPLTNPNILDISPDRTELLVAAGAKNRDQDALWMVPKSGGTPRRVGDVEATHALWSRDGRSIFFIRDPALYRINVDGTELHKVADVPGRTDGVREAPAPERDVLRFSLFTRDMRSSRLWEVGADGAGLHPLPTEHDVGGGWPDGEYSGDWIPSGRYYLFLSRRADAYGFWALRDGGLFFPGHAVQIYSTPLQVMWLSPSRDGKKLFFAGSQERRDLVCFDASRKQFLPFLPGVAGRSVSFSNDDRRELAYTTVPQDTLWKSGADGSGSVQLTPTGIRAFYPRWSPDGKHIAFMGRPLGKPTRVYVVSANGGDAVTVGSEPSDGAPSWSADGKRLLIAREVPEGGSGHPGLYIVNWNTSEEDLVPGSETFLFSAWSPDSRYVAATGADAKIHLFDFKTGRWTLLAEGVQLGYPLWSHDGKYVYFQDVMESEDQPIFRVRISDRKKERLMSGKELPQSEFTGYALSGLTPDDAPIASVMRTNSDIYALDLELP